jgi:hypothetical protein
LKEIWDKPVKTQTKVAWREVLDVVGDPEYVALRRMSSVFRLPDQIRAEMQHLDSIDPSLVETALPAVETVLQNWTSNNNIDWFRKTLGEGNLSALMFGSSALSRARPEPEPTAQDLERIEKAVDDIQKAVQGSSFSPARQEEVSNLCDEIREAVAEADIAGFRPLVQSAQRAAGLALIEGVQTADKQERSILKKLVHLAVMIYSATSLAAAPLSLPASIDYIVTQTAQVFEAGEVHEEQQSESSATEDQSEPATPEIDGSADSPSTSAANDE